MTKKEDFQYPCVISNSPSISPSYLPLPEDGRIVTVGRESNNDIRINASHISRLHAEIRFNARGNLEIKDMGRNGVSCGGQRIPQGEVVEIQPDNQIRLDFKNDLVLEVLFRTKEKNYSAGAVNSDGTQTFSYNKGAVTEVFFLNEQEDADSTEDLQGDAGKFNFKPKSDENTKGLFSLAGNKSLGYHNRGQNYFSVFSDLGKQVPLAKGVSSKKGYNFSPSVMAITAALSLLAIVTAVLIF